jgi:hypothetical protein
MKGVDSNIITPKDRRQTHLRSDEKKSHLDISRNYGATTVFILLVREKTVIVSDVTTEASLAHVAPGCKIITEAPPSDSPSGCCVGTMVKKAL